MKTFTTFTEFFNVNTQAINDHVYTTMLDLGVSPGEAYEIAFIDVPLSDYDNELIESEAMDLSDDLFDTDL